MARSDIKWRMGVGEFGVAYRGDAPSGHIFLVEPVGPQFEITAYKPPKVKDGPVGPAYWRETTFKTLAHAKKTAAALHRP